MERLAQGAVQHNKCSKVYYYVRGGLRVVCERPIPNNHLISETNLGFLADYGDISTMTEMVEEATSTQWNRTKAMLYMLDHHTWDARAGVYDATIAADLER